MTKMVPTHPDLPDLPEGQFWRIYTKYECIEYTYVELREKTPKSWFRKSRRIVRKHTFYDPLDSDVRGDAIWLAEKIISERRLYAANTLGDLYGDHPPD